MIKFRQTPFIQPFFYPTMKTDDLQQLWDNSLPLTHSNSTETPAGSQKIGVLPDFLIKRYNFICLLDKLISELLTPLNEDLEKVSKLKMLRGLHLTESDSLFKAIEYIFPETELTEGDITTISPDGSVFIISMT